MPIRRAWSTLSRQRCGGSASSSPTTRRVVLLGAWAAVAFYWRADHGVYVALAVPIACLVAHGLRPATVTRCLAAGATTMALVAPFLVYVQATLQHTRDDVQTGVAAAQTEHVSQGPHAWPVLRFWTNAAIIEPAESYAPTIGIRWTSESSAEERRQLLVRYDLTLIESEDACGRSCEAVRLAASRISAAALNEPIVADTAGVDQIEMHPCRQLHGQPFRRWKLNHPWLRHRAAVILPTLDSEARARARSPSHCSYALPPRSPMMRGGPMVRALLVGPECRAVSRICLVGLDTSDAAMLRLPFPARMADAVVLSAIVFGCCVCVCVCVRLWAGIWRAAAVSRGLLRRLLGVAALALPIAVFVTVTVAGRFADTTDGARRRLDLTEPRACRMEHGLRRARGVPSALRISSTSVPVSASSWPLTFVSACPEFGPLCSCSGSNPRFTTTAIA